MPKIVSVDDLPERTITTNILTELCQEVVVIRLPEVIRHQWKIAGYNCIVPTGKIPTDNACIAR